MFILEAMASDHIIDIIDRSFYFNNMIILIGKNVLLFIFTYLPIVVFIFNRFKLIT